MASLFLNIGVSGIGKVVHDFLLAYMYMPEQGYHLRSILLIRLLKLVSL